ncbi:herpeto-tandem family RiPP [Corallococcus exiguus]|nr:herpeto-tandem family RiPP [Corallococcus exiguus]
MLNAANKKAPIFGLQYIEEEEATLMDVVGCQGVVGMAQEAAPKLAITIRSCGDIDADGEEELEP